MLHTVIVRRKYCSYGFPKLRSATCLKANLYVRSTTGPSNVRLSYVTLSVTLIRFLTLRSARRAKSYNTRITHTISKHIRLVLTEAFLKSSAGIFIFYSNHEIAENIWFNSLEFNYFENVSLPSYHLENKNVFKTFFARFQSVLKKKNSQIHWQSQLLWTLSNSYRLSFYGFSGPPPFLKLKTLKN